MGGGKGEGAGGVKVILVWLLVTIATRVWLLTVLLALLAGTLSVAMDLTGWTAA